MKRALVTRLGITFFFEIFIDLLCSVKEIMFFRLQSAKFITGFIVADCDHVCEEIIDFCLYCCICGIGLHLLRFVLQNKIHILKRLCHHESFDKTC